MNLNMERTGVEFATYKDALLHTEKDSNAKKRKQGGVMTMCDGADETSDYKLHKFRTIYEMYEKTLQKYWMELVYTKPQNVTREMGVTYINRHTLETYVYPYPTLAVVCENGEKVSAGALFAGYRETNDVQGMISLMASLLKCGCCYKHSHIYEGAQHTQLIPLKGSAHAFVCMKQSIAYANILVIDAVIARADMYFGSGWNG